MKYDVYNQDGKKTSTVDLPEAVFSVPLNNEVLHQAVYVLESNARTPIAHARTRGEVAGGGRKPWRQKGTGRARHGSIRSPIWKGGGVTHGPRNDKNRTKKLNRKVATKALFMALSGKKRDNELLFLDTLSVSGKTSNATAVLKSLSAISGFEKLGYQKGNRGLIVVSQKTPELTRAFGNIESVDVEEAKTLNVLDVLGYQYVIVVSPEEIIETLSQKTTVVRSRKDQGEKKEEKSPAPKKSPAKKKTTTKTAKKKTASRTKQASVTTT